MDETERKARAIHIEHPKHHGAYVDDEDAAERWERLSSNAKATYRRMARKRS